MPPGADTRAPLRDLQESFLRDLQDLAPRDPVARSAVFARPPSGSVEDRWSVYRNAYVVRLADAMGNDYPAVLRVLGRPAFLSLASRYLVSCLPSSFDIGRTGDRLPEFLAGDPLTGSLPFLPDLARFEWALASARVAADAAPLRIDDLAALGAERVADMPLRLMPGAAVVRSRWPLHEVWLAKDRADADVDVPLEGRPTDLLVWRKGLEVRWRVLDAAECAVVTCASEGSCLGDVFQRRGLETPYSESSCPQTGPLENVPVPDLGDALVRLAGDGALAPSTHIGDASSAPERKETA